MNLILLTKEQLDGDGRAVIRGKAARHIDRVLKATKGGRLKVGLINGAKGEAIVESVEPDAVIVQCQWKAGAPCVRPVWDLLLALPRPKVMKRLWAQLAAVGVGRIVIVNAEKVERSYFDTHWLDPEFYQPLLVEGLEQASETALPEVRVVRRLKPFLEDEAPVYFSRGQRFVADPAGETPFHRAIEGARQGGVIAVGPEGGWSRFELDMFQACGFKSVRAGRRILRSDTACVVLLGIAESIAAT